MINYPNKKSSFSSTLKVYANRGMNLEEAINITNQYYLDQGIAVIHKKPTPIQIVKIDYTNGARISDAYFKSPSTTDYNGIYKGRYLDFEAKETQNKTSFPFHNIGEHQLKHLEDVLKHGAIAFLIISFTKLNEIYFLDAQIVLEHYHNKDRKSIPYSVIKEKGHLLKQGYFTRVDFLEVIDKYYLA
jgi:recombination protein U